MKHAIDIALFLGLFSLSLVFLSMSASKEAFLYFYNGFFLFPENYFYLGISLFFLSLLFAIAIYATNHKTYLTVKMSTLTIEVDQQAIKDLVDFTLHKNFPKYEMESRVQVSDEKILSIEAFSKPIDPQKREKVLHILERKIGAELKNNLAYSGPFYFTLKTKPLRKEEISSS